MAQKKLIWHLFPSYVLISLITVVAVLWSVYLSYKDTIIAQKSRELELRGQFIYDLAADLLKNGNMQEADSLVDALGRKTGTRITLIMPDGHVLADSFEDPARMENHLDRPEIRKAETNSETFTVRYSFTLRQDMLYVAIPIVEGTTGLGFLRLAMPVYEISAILIPYRNRIIISSITIILFILLSSYLISRKVNKPLQAITEGIRHFAGGDLTYRIHVPKSAEIGTVTQALNNMAIQLDEKIKIIVEQKNEQQAVLESMVEGVIAVNRELQVISINKAAATIFDLESQECAGRQIHELIRNSNLLALVEKTFHEINPVEEEIIIRNPDERYLQTHGTVLKNAQNNITGALIVMNDVTRLRRLENVRRDFVANVSHEIRTPLTSIKGFAETLAEDGFEDMENARHFIDIISRQSNRLNAIIDDLLTLARLEQSEDRSQIEFKRTSIIEVVNTAIEVCKANADKKKICIQKDISEEFEINMNAALVEQALVNLIDNAIKYSPEESRIEIRCNPDGGFLDLSVKDEGPGIEQRHLPRLFERFYRVDKARSRDEGGTGLGLAIVKHIAQVHGGRAEVESQPGKGSTFHVKIPMI